MHGVLTAMITPFKRGQLDELGFAENVNYQVSSEVDGLVILGTTAEAPTLTQAESERIIQIAIEEANHKVPIIVGVGTNSTATTVERAQRAEELGADGLLVVCPYYNKPTQEGLYLHFAEVAKATSLPIIVYNHPGRTGINMDVHTLSRLAELRNIVGVKEASGDLGCVEQILSTISSRGDFAVFSGDDPLTLPMLALGAHGVISVASNLAPRPMIDLVHAGLQGSFEEARMQHYLLQALFKACTLETNPIPIKALMNLAGMPAGNCRLPLTELSPKHHTFLEEVLEPLSEHLALPLESLE